MLGQLAVLAQYGSFCDYAITNVTLIAAIKHTGLIFAAAIGWTFIAEVATIGVVFGASLMAAGGIRLGMLSCG